MMTDSPLNSTACSSCHRLKRKCTRSLPTCALCARVGRACQYPDSASPSTPTSLPRVNAHRRHASYANHGEATSSSRQTSGRSSPHLPRLQLASHSSSGLNAVRALDGTGRFPAAWFLDSVVCRGSRIVASRGVEWDDLVAEPGAVGREAAEEVVRGYFEGTQCWLPICMMALFEMWWWCDHWVILGCAD